MRKLFSLFTALTLSVGLWATDHYVPITIDANTLNGDVVMGKNQSVGDVWKAGHENVGLDETACFYSNDCTNEYIYEYLSYGLPASVNVPNLEGVDVPFNFAWTGTDQFDGNDAIHLISDGEAVTVDLKGGNAFTGLYFLATAGNAEAGSSSITVTITYSDETSAVSAFDILDWYYDETEGKPANAIQEFYRYVEWDDVDYADNGPCLYCLSLNDALDPLKPIKSLTFTQTNDEMCTAIFAITGILSGCTPQAPQNTSGSYTDNTTTITFDEVKDLDGNDITGVTYVYNVARDPNFIKMLDGHINQPLSTAINAGKVTGTINADLNGLYIRIRAKNSCGMSLNSNVIVNNDAEYFTVTIPDSEDYAVSGYVSDARYLSGETDSFTAQILGEGKELVGWKDNSGTSLSTTSQVSITITENTTIMPVVVAENREITLADGVTGKMGTLDKDYPWLKTTTKPGLAYRSTNKGKDDTESRDTLVITPETGVSYRLKFDYAVSSEIGYDKMSVWVNGEKIADQISGEASGSYDSGETLLTEPTTIVMSYGKEESSASGEDRGYIYNIVVTSNVPNRVYTRDNLSDGKWGTICLGYAVPSLEGVDATFYKLNYYDGASSLYVTDVTELEAGKPYVFEAKAESFSVVYIPTDEPAEAQTINGLVGTITGLTMETDAYALVNNMVVKAAARTTVPANRAYIDLTQVSPTPLDTPSGAPRRIGVAKAPTSLDQTLNTKHQTQKLLRNGQFVIIRDGKTYNAQGQMLQ